MASRSLSKIRVFDWMDWDWASQARSKASVDALAVLAAVEPAVAAYGGRDLGDVICAMRAAEGRGRAPAAVQAMLRSQAVHPLVGRALLQAVVPGLASIGVQFRWGEGSWGLEGAFAVDLVSTGWEVITQWAGEDRPYAVLDLLSAIRCRVRRQVLARRSQASRETDLTDVDVTVPWQAAPTGLDELARAIEAVVGEHPDERMAAATVYAVGVLGYSLSEVSTLTGRSRRYVAKLRDHGASLVAA